MTQHRHTHLVGIFRNRHSVHQAILALQNGDISPERIKICTSDPLSDSCIGGIQVKAQPQQDNFWESAKSGAFTGGIGSGLLGLTEGINLSAGVVSGTEAIALPVQIVGTIAAATLVGVAIGTVGGGVLGALVSWGVPSRSGHLFKEIKTTAPGDYLVLLTGSEADVAQAKDILGQRGRQKRGHIIK